MRTAVESLVDDLSDALSNLREENNELNTHHDIDERHDAVQQKVHDYLKASTIKELIEAKAFLSKLSQHMGISGKGSPINGLEWFHDEDSFPASIDDLEEIPVPRMTR